MIAALFEIVNVPSRIAPGVTVPARAEFVPSFYETQNPIRLLDQDNGVQRQRLDMFLRASNSAGS
jgi:hypothetical protein